jgi:hypothetical protein
VPATKAAAAQLANHRHATSTSAPAGPLPVGLPRRLGNQSWQLLLRARLLQAKLTVSDPHDVYEQEADRVADQVMRMRDPTSVTSLTTTRVQRTCRECDDELMRSASPAESTPSVDAPTEHAIRSLSGSGSPLPDSVRGFMEPRFNADFSGVLIHDYAQGHDLARALNAHAFTVGRNVVFGEGRYAPHTDSGRRLLAHELTHVVQQRAAPTSSPTLHAPGTVQRQAAAPDVDPWSKLSPAGRKRARVLYDRCMELLVQIGDAQRAHVSVLRSAWLNFLHDNLLVRIGNLDRDDKIDGLENVLQDYSDRILHNVANFFEEWEAVERRCFDEHAWLLRQNFADANLAARRLEELYAEATTWLDRGAMSFITDEDYRSLKETLEKGTHFSVGILKASRDRARMLAEMLDVVQELRLDGVDPDKYVPGWRTHVQNELDNLERLATRTRATAGFDYPAELARLRKTLGEKRDIALRTKKRERPVLGKAIDLVSGGIDAVVAPLVEAAKQAVDLAQINLHIISFGKYEPKFISALAAAAEQGATTTDVLKGMVVGLLETPERFLKAVEDGDWEAIGREAVNLYGLAKLIKATPHYVKQVPALLAKTNRALRILRARTFGAKLNEPRLAPPVTHKSGTANDRSMAGRDDEPPARPRRTTAPPPLHPQAQRFLSMLDRGVDRTLQGPLPADDLTRPSLPSGLYRGDIATAEEAFRAYNEAVLGARPTVPAYPAHLAAAAERAGIETPGVREVGVEFTAAGKFRVWIGGRGSVGPPHGTPDAGHFLVHFHPNEFNSFRFRLPSGTDIRMVKERALDRQRLEREFVETDIPGVGRGRTEYGFDPGNREKPIYVRIHHPDAPPEPLRFANLDDYYKHWDSIKMYVGLDSWLHRYIVERFFARSRSGGDGGETGAPPAGQLREMAGAGEPPGRKPPQPPRASPPNRDPHGETQPLPNSRATAPNIKLEQIGLYSFWSAKQWHGGLLHHRVTNLRHLGDPANSALHFSELFRTLVGDAITEGASALRITWRFGAEAYVPAMERLVARLVGGVHRVGPDTVEVFIRLPASFPK